MVYILANKLQGGQESSKGGGVGEYQFPPMIAFPQVRTIYIYICLCHLREYALYT